jgi:hypothetical protein
MKKKKKDKFLCLQFLCSELDWWPGGDKTLSVDGSQKGKHMTVGQKQ